MKTKTLGYIHQLARGLNYYDFEQVLKAEFSGRPPTEVIEMELVLVDWADVSDLQHRVDELEMGEDF